MVIWKQFVRRGNNLIGPFIPFSLIDGENACISWDTSPSVGGWWKCYIIL